MNWLVFALSLVLILAGAVSVISGAPIIQIERGWAEVIAGTVAVAGGGVTFAIGVVLVRIDSLVEVLRHRGQPLSQVSDAEATESKGQQNAGQLEATPVDFANATAVTVIPVPDEAAENVVMAAEAVPETGQGLWKRVIRPAESVATEHPVLEEVAPEADLGEIAHREMTPAPFEVFAPDPHDVPSVAFEPERDERQSPAPSESVDKTIETEAQPVTDPSFSWLDNAIAKTKTPSKFPWRREPRVAAIPLEPTPLPMAEPVTEFDGGLVPRDEPQVRPTDERENHPVEASHGDDQGFQPHSEHDEAQSLAPPSIVPPEASEGVTVIGRYQAGVASYVMYSDGTIDVETEGGDAHRFGSMEELKAFIAHQETTVS